MLFTSYFVEAEIFLLTHSRKQSMWIAAQLPLQRQGETKGFYSYYSSIRQILHLFGYTIWTVCLIETSCFNAGLNVYSK